MEAQIYIYGSVTEGYGHTTEELAEKKETGGEVVI